MDALMKLEVWSCDAIGGLSAPLQHAAPQHRAPLQGPGIRCYSRMFLRVRLPVAVDPSNRATSMIIRFAILLLLCHASMPVLAGESLPDGAGECPSALAGDELEGADGPHGGDTGSAAGDKGASPRRGNAESGMGGPRMHNLLPGMFR